MNEADAGIIAIVLGVLYIAFIAGLIVATFYLASTYHPVWATITGIPGFYLAYKAIRAWRPW